MNKGSGSESQLRCYMNLMAFDSLEAIRDAGFEGVQFAAEPTREQLAVCRQFALSIAGSGRVNSPLDANAVAEQASRDGLECVTVHVGWGLEDDDETARLVEAVLQASQRWSVPLYIETHRATVCQDMWRTVQLVRRFPEIRFNGDFSHWYAGQEMVYGGFQKKFEFIQPVLDRIRFIHGRIANPGCIQVAIPEDVDEPSYVKHFRQLWTASFAGFLRNSEPHEHICFTPELLGPDIYYARTFNNQEESDRWRQSLLLARIARECFSESLSSDRR